MRLSRILLTLGLVAALGAVALMAQRNEPPGVSIATAAEKFVGSLTAQQKAKATFAFDSKERTNWHFVPLQDKERRATRKGLPLQDMTAEQKKAALELVAAGTSERGDQSVLSIMSLEAVLHDLEKGGAMVRNPEWYFFTVFGTPSKTGKWGWRVEGHHLSLNFTLDGGRVVSATPAFFGANPATIKSGAKKGKRTLPQAEDLARDLFLALDEEQQKVAHRKQQFPEPKAQSVEAGVGEPQGLAAAKMNPKQRMILQDLVRAYANRMRPDIAEEQLKQVRAGGTDKIHFSYAGGTKPGQPHSYRVQGTNFVIEFLNTQADGAGNPANHIHSVWRNLGGDFGISRGG
jgi:hypothetical protein